MLGDGANGYDALIAFITLLGTMTVLIGGVLTARSQRRKLIELERHATDAVQTATEAKDTAAAVVEVGNTVKAAVGDPNGNGNLTEMIGRILADQAEAWHWRAQDSVWKQEHDAKDDATRADVELIKNHLGLDGTT